MDARNPADRRRQSGSVSPRHVLAGDRKAGKRMMQSTLTVSSFEPPSKLGLHVEASVMKGDLSFRLAPKSAGTEVTYEAQMWGKGLMRLMTGTMNRMMAAEDDDILERLRSQVESRRP